MEFNLVLGLFVFVVMCLAMICNYKTSGVLLVANLAFYFLGILNLKELIHGFSNVGILTVLAFYPLLIPITNSFQINGYIHRIFMFGSTNVYILTAKIIIPVFFFSFFINNTPIVHIYLHFIDRWCQSTGHRSSHYLIPLSYATILGGTNTLIGTSTNLLAAGIVQKYGITLSFFQLARLSLLPGLIAILLIIALAPKLLTNYQTRETILEESRFKCEITIPRGCDLIGVNIKNWIGVYCESAKIYDSESGFVDIGHDARVTEGVTILLYGTPGNLVNFLQEYSAQIQYHQMNMFSIPDLIHRLAEIRQTNYLELIKPLAHDHGQFYKVIISEQSPLYKSSIDSHLFEKHYFGTILACSDTEIKAGLDEGSVSLTKIDNTTCLLVYGSEKFLKEHSNSDEFINITRYRGKCIRPNLYDRLFLETFTRNNQYLPTKVRRWHVSIAILIITLIISNFHYHLLTLTLVALIIQVVLNIIPYDEAVKSINWDLYFMLALSIPLGQVIVNLKLDHYIAEGLMTLRLPYLIVIFLTGILTSVLTNVLNNASAITVMVPIVLQIARQLSCDPILILEVTICLASVSLLTPFGYQTNLMIQKSGNYRFMDYFKFGSIITTAYLVVLFIVATIIYFGTADICTPEMFSNTYTPS